MLDDLDRLFGEFDLLNNPHLFRTGADRTTAVRTAVQSVIATCALSFIVTVHGVKPLKNKGLLRWQGEKNSEISVSLPTKRGFWGVIADFTP